MIAYKGLYYCNNMEKISWGVGFGGGDKIPDPMELQHKKKEIQSGCM